MAIAVDEIVDEQRSAVPHKERRRWPLVVLGVVAIVLAGFSVHNAKTLSSNADASQRESEVIDTTRRVVAQLVSLDHSTASDDLARIAADSTGSFKDQFDEVSGSFAEVLGNGQVESTGEVTEAGIVDSTDEKATVLAAVTSTVKNTEAPGGQQRVYRMKVSLGNVDGNWLVSNVEFVA